MIMQSPSASATSSPFASCAGAPPARARCQTGLDVNTFSLKSRAPSRWETWKCSRLTNSCHSFCTTRSCSARWCLRPTTRGPLVDRFWGPRRLSLAGVLTTPRPQSSKTISTGLPAKGASCVDRNAGLAAGDMELLPAPKPQLAEPVRRLGGLPDPSPVAVDCTMPPWAAGVTLAPAAPAARTAFNTRKCVMEDPSGRAKLSWASRTSARDSLFCRAEKSM
mmetsp:Transcript_66145/g.172072  ORF Transcript_66145/g.172072 Transcript_66145/m.172072 type:complete len:221 (-) Transcript_66145:479-1141(-)